MIHRCKLSVLGMLLIIHCAASCVALDENSLTTKISIEKNIINASLYNE
jgi:hypothetical protein